MITLANEIYKEFSLRKISEQFTSDNPHDNLKRLNDLVIELSITKCTLTDLDFQNPGTSLYLTYILQKNEDIQFGFCEMFKMWKNKEGWQYGCKLDKGKGIRIQVYCNGRNESLCKRKEKYKQYLQDSNVEIGNIEVLFTIIKISVCNKILEEKEEV